MERIPTRDEHLEWCKNGALAYIERGELVEGISFMASELNKHPETEGHSGIKLAIMMVAGGHVISRQDAEKLIEGFR